MINLYKETIPEYAKDIKLNFSQMLGDESSTLTPEQIAGISLSCAYVTDNEALIRVLHDEYGIELTDERVSAAKAAASIMAMNNVYYRFTHLVSNKEYQTLPAKLRMNVIADPGVDKIEFELYSLAISAINGCGLCMDLHTKVLEKSAMSTLAIQQAVKIGAIVAALTQVAKNEALAEISA